MNAATLEAAIARAQAIATITASQQQQQQQQHQQQHQSSSGNHSHSHGYGTLGMVPDANTFNTSAIVPSRSEYSTSAAAAAVSSAATVGVVGVEGKKRKSRWGDTETVSIASSDPTAQLKQQQMDLVTSSTGSAAPFNGYSIPVVTQQSVASTISAASAAAAAPTTATTTSTATTSKSVMKPSVTNSKLKAQADEAALIEAEARMFMEAGPSVLDANWMAKVQIYYCE